MKNRPRLSLFFISGALLSFEIALMRILKVEGFGPFTYGAIGLALTGFGTGGTLMCLLRKRLSKHLDEIGFWGAVLFVFLLGVSCGTASAVRFDPLRILWDSGQVFRLLTRFFFYALPFIAGSCAVISRFMQGEAGRTYFFNLAGSAFGVPLLIGSMYLLSPDKLCLVPALLGLLAVLPWVRPAGTFRNRARAAAVAAAAGAVIAGFFLIFVSPVRMLPYKPLKLALNLPDARIILRRMSPFGTIEVVESPLFRSARGLSLNFEGTLPAQHGLFIDGDLLAALDHIEKPSDMDYLLYQTQSAVYQIHRSPDTLVIGLGGGTGVERAFRCGAGSVTAVETNPHLPKLLTVDFRNFNSGFFIGDALEIRPGSGRFPAVGELKWDIIDIPECGSLLSSTAGIYSTDANYTLTVEAFTDYLDSLEQNGTVSSTTGLRYPPGPLLKLVNTAGAALRARGLDPAASMMVFRSWSSGTVLVKKRPFKPAEIARVKDYCTNMSFDLVYYSGMEEYEANRYNIVEDAAYFRGTSALLRNAASFETRYVFDIRAPTDNRPYFLRLLRPGKTGTLFRQTGMKWLFIVEEGSLVQYAVFFTALLLSALLILLPPLLLRGGIRTMGARVPAYFGFIAISYMFIEVLLIERYRRYIPNPLFSSSAVITVLLLSSGAGSRFSDKWKGNYKIPLFAACGFITAYFPVPFLLSGKLLMKAAALHTLSGILLMAVLTAPLGFAMGFFFPVGLRAVGVLTPSSLPYAWSVNGFFSVIASTGVIMTGAAIGITITGAAGVLFYWGALFFFPAGRLKGGNGSVHGG